MLLRILATLWEIVRTDRIVQAGAPSSGASLWGAHAIAVQPSLVQAHAWVAFFAAVAGGLSATAICVYTCIKIYRLLKQPSATE